METQKNLLTTSFSLRWFLMLFFFGIISLSGYAQTITDVYPTRVTEGVTVTIEGTGFTTATRNSIRFKDGGMNVRNRQLIGSTTMTFEIGRNATSNNVDPSLPHPNDIIRELQIEIGGALTDTGIDVEYIAPKAMIQAEIDFEGRIPIPASKRVEEIYTDYGGVKTYQDGDQFTRGSDVNSTTFGRWEFFDLVFPATPTGVLVETGGRGRGMFIGFNRSTGEFVARGGDGRPPATPTPSGTARVALPASTFAGKSGRLLVTMDPRQGLPTSGQLTIEWDEGDDGSVEFSTTVTAVDNYLGYDAFREWSGGDRGFVGNSNKNLAGNEITGSSDSFYDFNGQIGRMEFSNSPDRPIAWRSSQGTYTGQPSGERPANPVIPDNYHDLLGFKINGIVYSTGANDDLLEMFLGTEILDGVGNPKSNYVRQRFKAYSTNGVQNTTVSQHHIFTGEFVDGKELESPTEFLTPINDPNYDPAYANINGLSMFDVLIDGKNGLNIGSGINNLNQSTSIQFFSGNGEFGGVSDGIPDLLIPNMAEAGGTDVYYYTDELGNVIGRPISIRINNSDSNNPPLSHWQNDQYSVTLGVSFDLAKPARRIYGSAQQRPMRLIAFSLDDFGITGHDFDNPSSSDSDPYVYETDISSINNINAGAGGTADIPFLAYNGETFQIRSPEVTSRPTPRSVCAVPSNIDVLLEVIATVDGGFTGDPLENLTFEWFQYNDNLTGANSDPTTSNYTVTDINQSDLGLYRIRVSNGYGTTIVTVAIEEGGTPAIWNGSSWTFPSGFVAAGGPNPGGLLNEVNDADRRLVFSENYTVSEPILEGCDCLIPAGKVVTVSNNKALKLYGEVVMNPEEEILDPDDGSPTGVFTPAGQLIVNDDASLVQTKDTDVNDNQGDMIMYREASNLNDLDYIFWSSPVDEFDLQDIDNSLSFQWDVRGANTVAGTDGNWVPYDGQMTLGRGYIARVPSASDFTTTFDGVPNNGLVTYNVIQSAGSQGIEDKHWNLIGNPYPSAISADKFLMHPANNILEGTLYIWDQTVQFDPNTANPSEAPFYENFIYNYVDAYRSYNAFGTAPAPGVGTFNGNIAAGQGFFVKVRDDVAGGPIEFRNPMRVGYSDEVLDNSGFYRNNENSFNPQDLEKEKLWLSLVNQNQQSSSLLIGYSEEATDGKDRLFDAYANRGDNELSLHSMLEDGEMVIQAKALPFDEEDYFKLGVNIPENGVYKIGIDRIEGRILENEDLNIILEDTYLGILHDLREKPYSFTGQVGKFNERFILRYTTNQLSVNEVDGKLDTFVFIKDKVFNVQSSKAITGVKVYDLSGKLVLDLKPEDNTNQIQRDFNFSRGVYIAIVTLENNIKFSKKVIN